MDNSDKKAFLELMNATSEYYQKSVLSPVALKIYFSGLQRFTYEQVEGALGQHISCGDQGQFYPKVVDIVKFIEGGKLTTDQILAMARICDTPLGVICRRHIGSFDLEHQTDMFYLKQRAEECLQLLPKWKEDYNNGDLSNNLIECMVKYGVSTSNPLCAGLQPPKSSEAVRSYESECKRKAADVLRLESLEPKDDGVDCEEGKKRMAEIIRSVFDEPKGD